MARRLHLFKGDHEADAVAAITPQVAAGDEVTVAILGDVAPPAVPPSASVRRVPDELSYDALIELIFASDAVVTW